MRATEFINEGVSISTPNPEYIKQQVNNIVASIKSGIRPTPDDIAFLNYARKQKIYHDDEIANNQFHKTVMQATKPAMRVIEKLWELPRDITDDISAIIGVPITSKKLQSLFSNPLRAPLDTRIKQSIKQTLLLPTECPKHNGTWIGQIRSRCYSKKYQWLLNLAKQAQTEYRDEYRAEMSPEQYEAELAKQRIRSQERLDKMSPEERKAYNEKARLYYHQKKRTKK